jgi:hypothetical protein
MDFCAKIFRYNYIYNMGGIKEDVKSKNKSSVSSNPSAFRKESQKGRGGIYSHNEYLNIYKLLC